MTSYHGRRNGTGRNPGAIWRRNAISFAPASVAPCADVDAAVAVAEIARNLLLSSVITAACEAACGHRFGTADEGNVAVNGYSLCAFFLWSEAANINNSMATAAVTTTENVGRSVHGGCSLLPFDVDIAITITMSSPNRHGNHMSG